MLEFWKILENLGNVRFSKKFSKRVSKSLRKDSEFIFKSRRSCLTENSHRNNRGNSQKKNNAEKFLIGTPGRFLKGMD